MYSGQCSANLSTYGPSVADTCMGTSYLLFMSLVDTILRKACKISDPEDRIIPKTAPDAEYDFVIIGAGTAGSTVAGRLAEIKRWKILLLEAGDDEPAGAQVPSFYVNYLNSSIDWKFETEPEPVGCQGLKDKRCPWPRGKVLGGSSVINGMMFMRGTPKDYQRWVDAGNTEWGYEQILPDFKSFEDNREMGLVDAAYHGIGGPVTLERYRDQPEFAWDVLKAAQEIGYNVSNDLSGKVMNGFSIPQMIVRDGVRLSLAKAFVRPQRNNPNFHVMLNSTASKILIDQNGTNKIASGVEFIYKNQTFKVKVRKEVIVSAGTIQTPQVLLLSGIGDKDILDSVGIEQVHDLPAVGKGLQNHVSFELVATIKGSHENLMNMETLVDYLINQNGPMSSTGLAQVTARLSSEYTTYDDPDIQFYFNGLAARCAATGVDQDPTGLSKVSIFPTYLHSKSKGYISLHSKNPFDPPKIVANYLTEEQDVNGVRAGIRIARRLFESPFLREKYDIQLESRTYGTCMEKHQWDSDEFWNCAIKYDTAHENHQGSSCKMGRKQNPEACVNQRLKLHGIDNIRIIDASVFPTLPSANPQASIIMVAERGARFIKEDYLKRPKRKHKTSSSNKTKS